MDFLSSSARSASAAARMRFFSGCLLSGTGELRGGVPKASGTEFEGAREIGGGSTGGRSRSVQRLLRFGGPPPVAGVDSAGLRLQRNSCSCT